MHLVAAILLFASVWKSSVGEVTDEIDNSTTGYSTATYTAPNSGLLYWPTDENTTSLEPPETSTTTSATTVSTTSTYPSRNVKNELRFEEPSATTEIYPTEPHYPVSKYLIFFIGVSIVIVLAIGIGITIYCCMKRKIPKKPASRQVKSNPSSSSQIKSVCSVSSQSKSSASVPSQKSTIDTSSVQRSVTSSEIASAPIGPPPGGPDLSPKNIPASAFNYRGPLVIDKRINSEDRTHLLDDPKLNAGTPKETDHISFDDRLNEVFEIGSEVERVIDENGKVKSPKHEKSEVTETSVQLFCQGRESQKEPPVETTNTGDGTKSQTDMQTSKSETLKPSI